MILENSEIEERGLMRNFVLVVSSSILSLSLLSADIVEPSLSIACGLAPWPSPNNYEIDIGFRRDKLTTKVSSEFVFDPLADSISELVLNSSSNETWQDLQILQVAGSGSYVSCTNYAVKVSGSYGNVYTGKYKFNDDLEIDIDGEDEDDIRIFSSSGKITNSYVYDVSGAVGYRTTSTGGRCIVTPYIGYSYHAQKLERNHGTLEVFAPPALVEVDIPVSNITYKPHWYGPWAGFDALVQVERCAYAFLGFEWHYVNYQSKHSNSFADSSINQSAHGQGYIVTLGAEWEIFRNWSIGLMGHYRNFRVWDGHQKLTAVDIDGSSLSFRSKLSRAQWTSGDVSALVAWRF